MIKQSMYNLVARVIPKPPKKTFTVTKCANKNAKEKFAKVCTHNFRKHMCYGASLSLFDTNGICSQIVYGDYAPYKQVNSDTFFRVASVSKLITALCVMKLAEESKISLDSDVHEILPYKIRDQKLTLRQLMTHTAGIHDGKSYDDLLGTGVPVTEMLNDENILPKSESYQFEYSNLGAGLVACVLEAKFNKSFEQIMQETLFKPLNIKASFYPQHLESNFSNLYNVLPFREEPELNAYNRQHKDDTGWDKPDPLQHYTLAQGNCNINADGLSKIGCAILQPGFLSENSLKTMRTPFASFGKDDWRLRQGIGIFIFNDRSIASHTLFGHQGFAYGAIFGLFIDLQNKDGMALCTSGCSLARKEVMAYINLDFMKIWQQRELWK